MRNITNLFKGRINRRNHILGLISGYGAFFLSAYLIAPAGTSNPISLALIFIVLTFCLLFNISLHVRRSHDLNKSGFLVLLLAVPLVNLFEGLDLLLSKGTDEKNTYGEPPSKKIRYPQDILNMPDNRTTKLNIDMSKNEQSKNSLEKKVWYRFLKVIYRSIFFLIILIVALWSLYAPPFNNRDYSGTVITCSDGKKHITDNVYFKSNGTFYDNNANYICGQQPEAAGDSQLYTVQVKYKFGGQIMGVLGSYLIIGFIVFIIFFLIKAVFFYIALGTHNPEH